jgi:hypothetical protein
MQSVPLRHLFLLNQTGILPAQLLCDGGLRYKCLQSLLVDLILWATVGLVILDSTLPKSRFTL